MCRKVEWPSPYPELKSRVCLELLQVVWIGNALPSHPTALDVTHYGLFCFCFVLVLGLPPIKSLFGRRD